MRKLGALIDQHVPEIAAMETQDCGQTIHTTGKVLIPRASHNFDFFAEICTHVDGECYPTDDHLNYTTYEPVGVCALISPWNVPFMTATWKVAPCLALGNTAVLKMSELSPLSANRLGELALQAGIPGGVLNVVHGYGGTVGDALVTHPDVRAISFTGSTATGNTIMSRGGLKKYSMELGGKIPGDYLRRCSSGTRYGCRAVYGLFGQWRALHGGVKDLSSAQHLTMSSCKNSPRAAATSKSATLWMSPLR